MTGLPARPALVPISPRTSASLLVAIESSPPQPAAVNLKHEPEVATLTAAIVRGDEAAFRAFHAQYAGRLLGYLLVLHRGDEPAARDIWQNTFVKAARRMRCFSTEAELWAWLATIARHASLDARRSSSRLARLRERLAN